MEFYQVTKQRYSHKARFDPGRPVPEADLRQIVEAAMSAPTAGNAQSPEFLIINDRALIEELWHITDNVIIASAPALIAVLTKPRVREVLDVSTECLIADAALATGFLQLAATALGYCCGWIDGPFVPVEPREKAQALLDIPADRMLMIVVPVGHPGEESARRPKKPFEQRASWNRYAVARL